MLGRSSLLPTTLVTGLTVVALSVAAANWLSQPANRSALLHLASGATAEPATTGTLREGVRQTRLDPCAAPARP
jgi:hypothetical protein